MPGNWEPLGASSARSKDEPVRTQPRPSRQKTADGGLQDAGTPPPMFVPEQPLRSLDDLVVAASVQERIDVAIRMVEHHRTLYHDWNLRKIDPHRTGTALNLYGPPGTGKTLCAEALAYHFGRRFINVSYAEIESRYVGETPKNIVRSFAAARQHDAVLVFDEADSILGSRLSDVTQSADHSVNVSRAVMLSQLDRFDGLVVFTSNFPKNYDAAFVRRILVHVRFELPDVEARQRLWALLLPHELPQAGDVDAKLLAEESEGLAGGDIANVVIASAAAAVGRAEEQRLVQSSDLRSEIERVRQSREEVGRPPAGARLVSWEQVRSEGDLPSAG